MSATRYLPALAWLREYQRAWLLPDLVAGLTLAAYADVASELAKDGASGALLGDGDGIQLGRSPRLFGQHVFVPRHGVAVHINAFNFPAWGLAEKAAVALLDLARKYHQDADLSERLRRVEERLGLAGVAGNPGRQGV